MPATAERKSIPLPTFAPPEWQIIPGEKPALYSEGVYVRRENVGRSGIPYIVTILDEKIEVVNPSYFIITQWILGHHDMLHKSKRHYGWQGNEMIRQFELDGSKYSSGGVEFNETEIDLSRPLTSNRWGRVE